MNKEENKR